LLLLLVVVMWRRGRGAIGGSAVPVIVTLGVASCDRAARCPVRRRRRAHSSDR